MSGRVYRVIVTGTLVCSVAIYCNCSSKSYNDRELYNELVGSYIVTTHPSVYRELPESTPPELRFQTERAWFYRDLGKMFEEIVNARQNISEQALDRSQKIVQKATETANAWDPELVGSISDFTREEKRALSAKLIELEELIYSLPGAADVKKKYEHLGV